MTPATMGWWRPTILLGNATQSWSDERLRAVFRHELAHIRRADWLVQQAAWVACSLTLVSSSRHGSVIEHCAWRRSVPPTTLVSPLRRSPIDLQRGT